ncbi:response regulator [Candidatus Woesearchaeota archaeon]|nr:response regulator [Candidatus Woesearchaeota archaeon]
MALRVLVVDDSNFMRSMIKNILKETSVKEILEASDGDEAVKMFRDNEPGLVFMDIMMPKKNGIEALREIMKIRKDAVVVMCTSVGQEKIINEAIEAGARDFITKPFRADEIKNIVAANDK